MRNKKTSKGITLIALVITIIVLLILAGVSIAMLTGKNGIITQAQNAKNKTAEAEVKEKEDLEKQNDIISNAIELPSTSDTRPFLPEGSVIINNDLKTGVTIKDSNGNEWVWIEVPKSIYTNTEYNGGTAPTSSEDYAKIESTMQKYAENYRKDSHIDEWYDGNGKTVSESTNTNDTTGCGLTSVKYEEIKEKMLKSVYENGGFWIGRYEAGAESYVTYDDDGAREVKIQKDMYPYNYISVQKAQELASTLTTDSNMTCSLMFGIQWDLTCKYIESKRVTTKDETNTQITEELINYDSKKWGNYYNSEFKVTSENAKKSEDDGNTYISTTKDEIKNKPMLLTTGASERNNILNIYDFAGNQFEWTLERSMNQSNPCTDRGGFYSNNGTSSPAAFRGSSPTSNSYKFVSFRPVLY